MSLAKTVVTEICLHVLLIVTGYLAAFDRIQDFVLGHTLGEWILIVAMSEDESVSTPRDTPISTPASSVPSTPLSPGARFMDVMQQVRYSSLLLPVCYPVSAITYTHRLNM